MKESAYSRQYRFLMTNKNNYIIDKAIFSICLKMILDSLMKNKQYYFIYKNISYGAVLQ